MLITPVGRINIQELSNSKAKKTNLKKDTSFNGENGYSKGTSFKNFHHEKRDLLLENPSSHICEDNQKQAQHFSHVQGSLWQQRLHEEWWRLLTFTSYPSTAEYSSILLARQGFIYCGKEDSVNLTIMCVFCSSLLRNLNKNVDIEEMHREANPNCPVVQGLEYVNKPMKEYHEGKFYEIFAQLYHFEKFKSSPSPQCHDQSIKSLVAPTSSLTTSLSQNKVSNNAQPLFCNSGQQYVSSETHNLKNQQNGASQLVTNHASALPSWQNIYHNQERPPDSCMVNSVDETPLQGQIHHNATTLESKSKASPAPHNTSISTMSSANERGNIPSSLSIPGNSLYSESQTPNRFSSEQRTHDARRNSSSAVSSNNGSLPSEPLAAPDCLPDQNQDVRDESMQNSHTSYEKLGIIIAHPKRSEYAVEITRIESFQGWPTEHHLQPDDLARAGFFFTGYGDCARCFHCGGGLRNWEAGDNIWVEHARWFPKCAFMQQSMGQAFIDTVQLLNKEHETISFDDVMAEMELRGLENSLPKGIEDNKLEIKRDPAVQIIINNGFSEEAAVKAAQNVKEKDQVLGADAIYEELLKQEVTRRSDVAEYLNESPSISQRRNKNHDRETLEDIKNKISEMRQLSLCKICMDKEVSVVFLPCSHYVSCNNCSFALRSCPFCRENIKGVVRAILN